MSARPFRAAETFISRRFLSLEKKKIIMWEKKKEFIIRETLKVDLWKSSSQCLSVVRVAAQLSCFS